MNEISVFDHDSYLIRRKIFTLFGAAFHVLDGNGAVIGYCRQKAFKLREDIRVYTDESCSTELLAILAREVIDFSASYDVVDPRAGEGVGTIQRKGFKSMFRDEWVFSDVAGEPVGRIQEDSMFMAMVRRHLAEIIPQSFTATADGVEVARFDQAFNPFVLKLNVRIMPQAADYVDPRLMLAAGVLLGAIEGRQE